jgi:hypothetical protein
VLLFCWHKLCKIDGTSTEILKELFQWKHCSHELKGRKNSKVERPLALPAQVPSYVRSGLSLSFQETPELSSTDVINVK